MHITLNLTNLIAINDIFRKLITKKESLILIIIWCLPFIAQGNGIRGKVSNENGNPISFASIYIQELSKGSMTGQNGEFEINLENGTYTISFHSLGYLSKKQQITIDDFWVHLDIELKTRAYDINEVVIKKSKEDPAYAIMRKAIALATYHKNHVNRYHAHLYVKGNLQVEKMKKLISEHTTFVINDKRFRLKQGDNFLYESYNLLEFNAPNQYNQKVISSKNSFPIKTNDGIDIFYTSSFYDQKINSVVSPLSTYAFTYYRFKYLGISTDGTHSIYKIAVIPKIKGRQVFSGNIYIIDGLWCLHSLELTNNSVLGKVNVNQLFENIKEDIWLPINYNVVFGLSFPGFYADTRYLTMVKYDSIETNNNIPVPALIYAKPNNTKIKEEAKQDREIQKLLLLDEKLNGLYEKEEINKKEMLKMARLMRKEFTQLDSNIVIETDRNYIYKVERDTISNDSVDWQAIRPIPLKDFELESYSTKDSLLTRDTLRIDSSRTQKPKKNPFTETLKVFTIGKSIINNDRISIRYNGLMKPDVFDFNAVDGFYLIQKFQFAYRFDSTGNIFLQPSLKYSFNRNKLLWELPVNLEYSEKKDGILKLSIGEIAEDYKGDYGIGSNLNMISSLCFKENKLKLYRSKYFEISNRINVYKGTSFKLGFKYMDASPLDNVTDFSFYKGKSKHYSPNIPANEVYNDSSYFSSHQSLTMRAGIEYKINPNDKKEHYPALRLQYKKGIEGLMGSSSSFDYLEFGFNEKLIVRLFTKMNFDLSCGGFINKNKIYFEDLKHYNTNNLSLTFKDLELLYALPKDYSYSNGEYFISGFYHLETPYLVLKYLPFIRNRIWNENLYINYLFTKEKGHYWETGYALTKVFNLFDIGVFAGFKEQKYDQIGLKISVR